MKNTYAANCLFVQAVVCLSFIIALASSAAAQRGESGKNEFEIWGGVSPDSSTVFKGFGRTNDARFGIVAVRYARRFNNSHSVNLKYTIDAVPAAILSDKTFLPIFVPVGTGLGIQTDRQTYYGFGVAPLGLQINFRAQKKLQPFVGGSGGLLYFNKTLQDGLGTRFNFTADVGGGVEYHLKKGRALTFGYKYYHISNGKRGFVNPGIDNNLFYVGYSFSK
ncbi:MAG: acyloxyacyl hydrolase [Pyrinomonadaceae bacterium]